MSRLVFNRAENRLTLLGADGAEVGSWDAANNVDSHAVGPWPDGTFDFVAMLPALPGDGPDSAYGDGPRFLFAVPGREGMEVHAGRASVPDGRGRVGFLHCTMGCIRTTRSAIAAIAAHHAADAIASITVQ